MNTCHNSVETMDSHESAIAAYVTAVKGGWGMFATFGALLFSSLPDLEIWLRITSLAVGITVGVVTLVSLVRKMPPRRKKPRN
jgi:hypothetical protein